MKRVLILMLLWVAALQAQYTTAIAPEWNYQIFDLSGRPCALCTITSYQAGTTTPLDTYQDNTLSTPNQNPLTLSASGTANIWLKNQAYKLVLKSALGTTLKTVDHVADVGLLLKRDLADPSASTGAKMVGYTQPGGALTTVKDQLDLLAGGPYANVKAYGAVCDGVTDDAPSIRAALATGSSIYFPKDGCTGSYLIDSYGSALYVNQHYAFELNSGQVVDGDPGATLKMANGFVISDATTGVGMFLINGKSNVAIRHITIDMNGANNLVPGASTFLSYAIQALASSYVTYDGVTIKNNPGRNNFIAAGPIGGSPSDHCLIQNNTSLGGGTSLVGNTNQIDFSAIYTWCTNATVQNNVIDAEATPFAPFGGIELHANGSAAIHNAINLASVGVYVVSDISGQKLSNIDVLDNTLTNVLYGVAFSMNANNADFDRVSIKRNRIVGLNNASIPFSTAAWGITQPRTDDGMFTYTGIINNSDISQNTFTDLTPSPYGSTFIRVSSVDGLAIHDNFVSGIGGPAISVIGAPSGTKNLSIYGNWLYDFGNNGTMFSHQCIYLDWTYGVGVDGYNAENVRIYDNHCSMPASTATALGFTFDWGTTDSTITNLNIWNNSMTNIAGALKSGSKASSVTIYARQPNNYFDRWETTNQAYITNDTLRFGADNSIQFNATAAEELQLKSALSVSSATTAYGKCKGFAELTFGAGGASGPDSSLCYGDGSGYYWVIGYSNSGTFVPKIYIRDNGGITLGSVTQANLAAASNKNGTMIYCSDCKNVPNDGASPGAACAASGSGAIARRENGTWNCN